MTTEQNAPTESELGPKRFRYVLGHFATGVVAITSLDDAGRPLGMVVSSFSSVSLDPPLVAFYPQRSSTTWPAIQGSGRFCANVLSSSQMDVCESLARKGGDKFSDLQWHLNADGLPTFPRALATISCEIDSCFEAGDHKIVLGRVIELQNSEHPEPLVFFKGGYGSVAQRAAFC